jgi:hypothetical protein
MILKLLYMLITNFDINLKFLRFKISFEIKINFEFGDNQERDKQFQLVKNS